MARRILSLALTFMMVFALFAGMGTASAADVIANGECGDDLTWTLTEDGTLTVSGAGKMEDYDKNTKLCDAFSETVKSVIINKGVESIGDYAFYEYTNLRSVDIPDSITSIGKEAFSMCVNLERVVIPDSVTELKMWAFHNCVSLNHVIIGNQVPTIEEWTFHNCVSLTHITIPDSVNVIKDCAFYGCTNLINVSIPNNISSIGNWGFYACDSLSYVYYAGTQAQWDLVLLGDYNEPLLNAVFGFAEVNQQESTGSSISIPVTGWENDYNWSGSTSIQINDEMLIINNTGDNHFSLKKTITVKPNTEYRFSALVRMENFECGENSYSGATVRFGTAYDSSVYNNDFNSTDQWKRSYVTFDSGINTSVTLSLALGTHGATCKGKGFFTDLRLEEIEHNNHWNFLVLIYKNVKLPGYERSFSDDQVERLKLSLSRFPTAVESLSNYRMLIDKIDVVEIDEPVRSISGDWGDLTYGNGQDIDFYDLLDDKDYQQIVVYAPIIDYPGNTGWYGLGGAFFNYQRRSIYYLIIDTIDNEGDYRYYYENEIYDAGTPVLLHETLHNVETNARNNGLSGFAAVHDAEENGFTNRIEWLDWYAALMRNEGLGGRGFDPLAFFVPHYTEGKNDIVPDDEYMPGDADGNGAVNTTDVILVRRCIAGGYNVTINENAADVDGNGVINTTDVILMRRFIAGGYGVVLKPGKIA